MIGTQPAWGQPSNFSNGHYANPIPYSGVRLSPQQPMSTGPVPPNFVRPMVQQQQQQLGNQQHLAMQQQRQQQGQQPMVDGYQLAQPVTAQSVAVAFAYQYFKVMKTKPQDLCRFYCTESKISRGMRDLRGSVVFNRAAGMQQIQDLLVKERTSMSPLCLAVIKTIEAQDSLMGSVIVQIVGALKFLDGSMRDFFMSTVLKKQDETNGQAGYYIYNDLFIFCGCPYEDTRHANQFVDFAQQESQVRLMQNMGGNAFCNFVPQQQNVSMHPDASHIQLEQSRLLPLDASIKFPVRISPEYLNPVTSSMAVSAQPSMAPLPTTKAPQLSISYSGNIHDQQHLMNPLPQMMTSPHQQQVMTSVQPVINPVQQHYQPALYPPQPERGFTPNMRFNSLQNSGNVQESYPMRSLNNFRPSSGGTGPMYMAPKTEEISCEQVESYEGQKYLDNHNQTPLAPDLEGNVEENAEFPSESQDFALQNTTLHTLGPQDQADNTLFSPVSETAPVILERKTVSVESTTVVAPGKVAGKEMTKGYESIPTGAKQGFGERPQTSNIATPATIVSETVISVVHDESKTSLSVDLKKDDAVNSSVVSPSQTLVGVAAVGRNEKKEGMDPAKVLQKQAVKEAIRNSQPDPNSYSKSSYAGVLLQSGPSIKIPSSVPLGYAVAPAIQVQFPKKQESKDKDKTESEAEDTGNRKMTNLKRKPFNNSRKRRVWVSRLPANMKDDAIEKEILENLKRHDVVGKVVRIERATLGPHGYLELDTEISAKAIVEKGLIMQGKDVPVGYPKQSINTYNSGASKPRSSTYRQKEQQQNENYQEGKNIHTGDKTGPINQNNATNGSDLEKVDLGSGENEGWNVSRKKYRQRPALGSQKQYVPNAGDRNAGVRGPYEPNNEIRKSQNTYNGPAARNSNGVNNGNARNYNRFNNGNARNSNRFNNGNARSPNRNSNGGPRGPNRNYNGVPRRSTGNYNPGSRGPNRNYNGDVRGTSGNSNGAPGGTSGNSNGAPGGSSGTNSAFPIVSNGMTNRSNKSLAQGNNRSPKSPNGTSNVSPKLSPGTNNKILQSPKETSNGSPKSLSETNNGSPQSSNRTNESPQSSNRTNNGSPQTLNETSNGTPKSSEGANSDASKNNESSRDSDGKSSEPSGNSNDLDSEAGISPSGFSTESRKAVAQTVK